MALPAIKFYNKEGRDFITELRSRVDKYFKDNNLSPNFNAKMVVKTITIFSVYFGAYALILTGLLPLWGMLMLCIVMGIATAGIGFSIAHDSLHGSYFAEKWKNRLLGMSMEIIGGSAYMWKVTHNNIHHTYTNIHNVDEDLEVTSLMRLSPRQPHKKIHRFQHYYFPVIYSLASFFWVFLKDYVRFAKSNPTQTKETSHKSMEFLKALAGKAVYYTYMIVIPLVVLHGQITWWQFIIGFMAMHLSAGVILGIVFQLAHVVEETEHLIPNEAGQMENSWAIHQFRTTANFGPTNKFLTWFVGGLNFQVEHHLFPNVCSIHYPDLSPIVQEVTTEFGVPYHMHDSFRAAVRSHVSVLKNLGKNAFIEIPEVPITPKSFVLNPEKSLVS
jgi:linoleoyl-CoA desaturase